MITTFDALLNRITMYRLTYYGLGLMAILAMILASVGFIAFPPLDLLASLVILLISCRLTNELMKLLFRARVTLESTPITALILFFILLPPSSLDDAVTIALTGVVAIVSKYFLTRHKYHVFNPAAMGVVIMSLAGSGLAGWWVATPWLVPVTLLIGLAVIRKLRRFTMVAVFLGVAAAAIVLTQFVTGTLVRGSLISLLTSWPLLFLASFMLTEPSSMPARHTPRLVNAAIIGLLLGTQLHLGILVISPALALIIGNAYSYVISRRARWRMQLRDRKLIAPRTYELAFATDSPVTFKPGQFLEVTVPHTQIDSRGNRRWFTIASTPHDPEVRLGISVPAIRASSYKTALLNLSSGDTIDGWQVAGDFILPEDRSIALTFIAGGIGITPFRSMIASLLASSERRDITLFQTSDSADGFVFSEVFEEARNKLGLQYIQVYTGSTQAAASFHGETGFLSSSLLNKYNQDALGRHYYISGPPPMVTAYVQLLREMQVPSSHVKTDFFIGY